MKVIIASHNPVKINAAREAFKQMFPGETFEVIGTDVPSDVSDQPMTDTETYTGAVNRAENASQKESDADFWVGIEGGLEEKSGDLECFAWVVIKDKDGTIGKGRSAAFFLPPAVAQKIREGMELGHAADAVFNETNLKQNQGTVGMLTKGLIERTKYYVDPAIMALIPFANPSLFGKTG